MKTKPKFNNTPNDRVRIVYNKGKGQNLGLDVWISRSVAVVSIVLVQTNEGLKALIVKRSDSSPEGGKYCLPCGYLDWDENCYSAMIRETYEETSLYLPDYNEFLVLNNNCQPIAVIDEPTKDKLQNVVFRYLTVFDLTKSPDNDLFDIEKFKSDETPEVRLIDCSDLFNNKYDFTWAFNHDVVIKEAVKQYNSIKSV